MKFKAFTTNGKVNTPYRVVQVQNQSLDKAYLEAMNIAKQDNHLFDMGWYIELEII